MARAPDLLTLERHRDLVGREHRPYLRWALLGLLAAFVVLGLANAFGQHPQVVRADGPVATLELQSPERLRSGLYFQSRFRIRAKREIENATLVLDPGWLDGMTLNTLEPSPVGEASRDGRIALELGHIPARTQQLFFLEFQVNPTTTGLREQDVELLDGETPLLALDRTVKVFP